MNKDKVVAFQKPEQAKYFRPSCGPMMTCSWNCRKIRIVPDAVPWQNASRLGTRAWLAVQPDRR
jgi:hypothetical protein